MSRSIFYYILCLISTISNIPVKSSVSCGDRDLISTFTWNGRGWTPSGVLGYDCLPRQKKVSRRYRDPHEKFVAYCPLTQTPTQKLKSGFSTSSSQGIASSLVLFEMIFEALQSELFRFKFHAPSLKILKIPEFNLMIIMPWISVNIG